MSDFLTNFDPFFNDLEGWFSKPRHLVFQCKTKDMMPAFWEKTEEGYKCTCRMVGIASNDVKVILKDDCIHVEGKSVLDNYEYSQSYDLPVTQDVLNNIKNIKYKTQDGITIIYIDLERPEKKKVNIEQIK
jgi:HSP20 family molecular chaperone IbpA